MGTIRPISNRLGETEGGLSEAELARLEARFGDLSPGVRDALDMRARAARGQGQDAFAACRDLAPYLLRAQERDSGAEGSPATLGAVRGRPSGRRTESTPSEREHARALADRIARFGNLDPSVLEFRASLGIPPGGLSEREALAVLRSPWLGFAHRSDLTERGVPLLGHEVRRLRESRAASGAHVRYVVSWLDGRRKRKLKFGWPQTMVESFHVEFPDEKGRHQAVPVSPVSVLADAVRVARQLAFRAPFNALRCTQVGAEAACVWLLLTGHALPLAPVVVTWEVPGSVDAITITALARVASWESVVAAFRKAQRHVLGHRKGRRFESRGFAVVDFAEREAGGSAVDFTPERWRELMRDWNSSCPRKERFAEPREMREAYLRAVEALFPDPREFAINALAVVDAEIKRRGAAR